ncbi:MAG: pyrroline-5-carboxylate reductase [Bacteroidota bacterium]
MNIKNIAVIGSGNIGTAIYRGIINSGKYKPSDFTLTRRRLEMIDLFKNDGVRVTNDNITAVKSSDLIILTVLPKQLLSILDEISPVLDSSKILVSVVTAYSINEIKNRIGKEVPVVLAMPNTAIAVGESMTCLAVEKEDQNELENIKQIFNLVGEVLVIPERLMGASTILAACGIAFFMRYIRAASQGGIQTGFHASEAQFIAAQTARGAAKLLLESGNHPETEIDKVTTPMGCTIAGLNEMEHNGMSSALIKGIVTSYNELTRLK